MKKKKRKKKMKKRKKRFKNFGVIQQVGQAVKYQLLMILSRLNRESTC
jgi:hypothetical protein